MDFSYPYRYGVKARGDSVRVVVLGRCSTARGSYLLKWHWVPLKGLIFCSLWVSVVVSMISSFNFKQSALNPWIKTMVDRIVEGFHPIQIILFGSYARGEATAHSDVDLLVVFPELSSKREMTISIRRILADLPMAKDIVVTTPAEIEEYSDLVGRVLRPALREGKVLYERSK